jgi:hypothetical protein
MTRKSLLVVGLVIMVLGGLTGCDQSSIPGGILSEANYLVEVAGLPLYQPAEGISINGQYSGPIPNSTQYGNVYSFPYHTTDETGAFVVDNAVRNAYWYSQVNWPGCGAGSSSATFAITYEEPVIGWLCDYTQPPSPTSPSFVTTDALPTSITVTQNGFSTLYGAPQLQIYLQGTGFVSKSLAGTVAPDGSSATFPFPKQANGATLSSGLYSYTVANQTSGGQVNQVGLGFFSVGYNSSMQTPYGVDAVDYTYSGQNCIFDGGWPRRRVQDEFGWRTLWGLVFQRVRI